MTFSKIALSTVLGGLVIAGGLVISLGPSGAGALLFFSIICTLGIGGVFWAALAFGVGWLIIMLWEAIRGDHAPADPEATPQAEALTTYVSRALQAGANDDQLQRRLQRQGWTEDEIAQAIHRVQGNPNTPGTA
jgi:hypothetical protein